MLARFGFLPSSAPLPNLPAWRPFRDVLRFEAEVDDLVGGLHAFEIVLTTAVALSDQLMQHLWALFDVVKARPIVGWSRCEHAA
ncbi:hypothetical protein ABIG06_006558 [Bradyrhizobium sp. USDA 326]|uniref:hypothetical protein n=1 Tax=Bradyrhizobium sp. USDA 313 TaxID=3156307 RepID=UPI003517E9BF